MNDSNDSTVNRPDSTVRAAWVGVFGALLGTIVTFAGTAINTAMQPKPVIFRDYTVTFQVDGINNENGRINVPSGLGPDRSTILEKNPTTPVCLNDFAAELPDTPIRAEFVNTNLWSNNHIELGSNILAKKIQLVFTVHNFRNFAPAPPPGECFEPKQVTVRVHYREP